MSQGNIEWVTDTDDNNLAIIACCGKWQAELAMDEPYTPGLVFVKPKADCKLFPNKLGDGKIDDLENLFELIHEIPTRMRNYLTCTVHGNQCFCKNVYLLSLNENVGNLFDYDCVQALENILAKSDETPQSQAWVAAKKEINS